MARRKKDEAQVPYQGGLYYPTRAGIKDHLNLGEFTLSGWGIFQFILLTCSYHTGIWYGSAPQIVFNSGRRFRLNTVKDAMQELADNRKIRSFGQAGWRHNYFVFIHNFEPAMGELANKGARLDAFNSDSLENLIYTSVTFPNLTVSSPSVRRWLAVAEPSGRRFLTVTEASVDRQPGVDEPSVEHPYTKGSKVTKGSKGVKGENKKEQQETETPKSQPTAFGGSVSQVGGSASHDDFPLSLDKNDPVDSLVEYVAVTLGQSKGLSDPSTLAEFRRMAASCLDSQDEFDVDDLKECLAWAVTHNEEKFSWSKQITALPVFFHLLESNSPRGLFLQFAAWRRSHQKAVAPTEATGKGSGHFYDR